MACRQVEDDSEINEDNGNASSISSTSNQKELISTSVEAPVSSNGHLHYARRGQIVDVTVSTDSSKASTPIK
jgi:hypothetical protein